MRKPRLPFVFLALLFSVPATLSLAAPAPPGRKPKELVSFQAHPFDIGSMTFSRDGKKLATAGEVTLRRGKDVGKVKIWEVPSGKLLLAIDAHDPARRFGARGRVPGLAFSPDGKTLASSGDDGNLKLWDAATGENKGTFTGQDDFYDGPLTFSPDGKRIICKYLVYDFEKGTDYSLHKKVKGGPIVAFEPKGNLLVGTTQAYPDPKAFVIWDAKTGERKHTCAGKREFIRLLAFHPTGQSALAVEGNLNGDRRWSLQLWDLATGKLTADFEQPAEPGAVKISPDGRLLAVTYNGTRPRDFSTIRLLEIPSGKLLATLKGNRWLIRCLAFSPNGRLLASAGGNGDITIWQLPTHYKPE